MQSPSTGTLEKLIEFNQTIFTQEESKLLGNLRSQWTRTKPLDGVTILHNIPVTYETLIKLESLIAAGAHVSLTQARFIPFQPEEKILQLLKEINIPYFPKHEEVYGEFDIALDCCAEVPCMKGVRITKGIVELTQSGGSRYKGMELPLPVINVDDSNLKKLEGMFGTGEAFVRAIKALINEPINDKHFLIFGFGKVGTGIVKHLLNETPFITVVDESETALKKAQDFGIQTLHVSEIEKIRARAREVFCIVTATGRSHFLSDLLKKETCLDAYIANIGADDEIGEQFSGQKVLFNKNPINFALNHPTLLHFLDPVFYAHNLGAQLLVDNTYKPGYYAFPNYLDDLIIKLWSSYYPVDISDIYK